MVRYSEGLKISDSSSFPHTKLKTVSMLRGGGKVCEQRPNYMGDLATLLFYKQMLNIQILPCMRHQCPS